MRPLALLLALLPAVLGAGAGTGTGTTVTFVVPASPPLPNPYSLPASTHATLSRLHAGPSAPTAPLSTANTFVFRNVSAGSYLVDVHCPTHFFAPLRLDVEEEAEGGGAAYAWETFRGNDWDNKGEAVAVVDGVAGGRAFQLKVGMAKNYFAERPAFSVFTILKNPMILLVDNMDPEMRAEFEERQKSNPMNSILGASQPGGQSSVGNFDMAAFLAGSNAQKEDAAPAPPAQKSGKKDKGRR